MFASYPAIFVFVFIHSFSYRVLLNDLVTMEVLVLLNRHGFPLFVLCCANYAINYAITLLLKVSCHFLSSQLSGCFLSRRHMMTTMAHTMGYGCAHTGLARH